MCPIDKNVCFPILLVKPTKVSLLSHSEFLKTYEDQFTVTFEVNQIWIENILTLENAHEISLRLRFFFCFQRKLPESRGKMVSFFRFLDCFLFPIHLASEDMVLWKNSTTNWKLILRVTKLPDGIILHVASIPQVLSQSFPPLEQSAKEVQCSNLGTWQKSTLVHPIYLEASSSRSIHAFIKITYIFWSKNRNHYCFLFVFGNTGAQRM